MRTPLPLGLDVAHMWRLASGDLDDLASAPAQLRTLVRTPSSEVASVYLELRRELLDHARVVPAEPDVAGVVPAAKLERIASPF
jgi:hypothetical protein